jgi:hypothetical protein
LIYLVLYSVEGDICQKGRNYASHNLAKYSLEFAIAIPRERLRSSYGDRLGGKPQTPAIPHHGVIEPEEGKKQ